MRSLLVSVLLVLVLASSGAAQPGGTAADRSRDSRASYRIGPEDVLYIAVWRNEMLSRSVTVRPDGMISLPLLNDIRAGGATPLELRALISEQLREHVADPEVSVIVTQVVSPRVTVMGEVMKPDRYALRSAATVLDMLAVAGGFTPQAVRSRIVIVRREGAVVRRIPFDYNRVIASGGLDGNPELQPGDTILVP